MAQQDRQAIIVLGMHRSGTSALAGTLAKLGVRLPARLLPENEYNPKGYFEPGQIVAIHDRLLAAAGLSWSSIAGLPKTWFGSDEARACAAELAEAVRQDYADAPLFVVKDPRMCRLMPLWRTVLDEVGAQARFVMPLRHPDEVARSLQRRDGLPLAQGYLLWLCHVLEAERETRNAPRVFVHFHDLLSDPMQTAEAVAVRLIGKSLAAGEDGAREIAALIDPALRHEIAQPGELLEPAALRPWLMDAYEAFAALIGNPTDQQAMRKLDQVSAAFEPAAELFAPLVAASDAKIASLVRSSATLDETNARLTQTVSELNGTVSVLRNTVAGLEKIVALQDERAIHLHRAIDAHKAHIDALNSQAEEIFQSTGWRLLAPLRWLGAQRNRLRQARRGK
ncbi:MAG TPA: sulfotransferase [Pseudolabrys sp.]|nr:sulfotransferase [Pseudolabrys sp.]